MHYGGALDSVRTLAPVLAPTEARGPSVPPAVSRPAPPGRAELGPPANGPEPETAEERASARSWWLIPAVIIVAIIAVLVGLHLVESYFPGLRSPVQPPLVTYAVTSDLCNASLGTNCVGNSFVLPATTLSGTTNTTGCDTVPTLGPGEQLWLNLTNGGTSPIDGILLATTTFGKSPVSWSGNPWRVFGNVSDAGTAPWSQSVPTGAASYVVPVPSTHADWCLGWWMPSGSTQITLNSDVTLTC